MLGTNGAKCQSMAESPFSDLELEHSKLRSDLDVVRRYGVLHSDDYVEERFENEPHVRLIVLMFGDQCAEHETALRALVEHPTQLEVRRTPFPKSRLEEIREEVNATARSRPRSLMQLGIGNGRVSVGLAADQESLASMFHDRFGDAVELSVGFFRYPPSSEADDVKGETEVVARPKLSLLPGEEFAVSLEREIEVASGESTQSTLCLENCGSVEAVIETNGAVTAKVVDPATGEGVGGYFGAQTLPLITFRIPPGGSASIPLLVGTTSSVRSLGYAVPPGAWAIEVPIKIAGRGQFRTSLLPILIQPPLRAS
jgi:hypothetical protein